MATKPETTFHGLLGMNKKHRSMTGLRQLAESQRASSKVKTSPEETVVNQQPKQANVSIKVLPEQVTKHVYAVSGKLSTFKSSQTELNQSSVLEKSIIPVSKLKHPEKSEQTFLQTFMKSRLQALRSTEGTLEPSKGPYIGLTVPELEGGAPLGRSLSRDVQKLIDSSPWAPTPQQVSPQMRHRVPLHLSRVAEKIESKQESSLVLNKAQERSDAKAVGKLFTINTSQGSFQQKTGSVFSSGKQPARLSMSQVSQTGGSKSPGMFIIKRPGYNELGCSPSASQSNLELIHREPKSYDNKMSAEGSLETLPSQRSIEEVQEIQPTTKSGFYIRSGEEQLKIPVGGGRPQLAVPRDTVSWGNLPQFVHRRGEPEPRVPPELSDVKPDFSNFRTSFKTSPNLDSFKVPQPAAYPAFKVVRFVGEEKNTLGTRVATELQKDIARGRRNVPRQNTQGWNQSSGFQFRGINRREPPFQQS